MGYRFTNAAHANDAELLVMDVDAEQILIISALPVTFLHITIELGNPAGCRQNQ
ncbi:hypothetical protein D3C77_617920 [compost metagenome]